MFGLFRKNDVKAQGIFDAINLFDAKTVQKIQSIVESIDVDKIKAVFDSFEKDDEGWLHVKIDLRIKKD